MSKLEWPRGRYYFGPIIITVDLIEPFIMSNIRIGIDPTDMHEIKYLGNQNL